MTSLKPTRRTVVGGNWKMNTDSQGAVALATEVVEHCGDDCQQVDVVVFPPFCYLHQVSQVIQGTGIQLGAQDVYPGADGAFTGEISTAMLQDLGVTYVLVGHSERRHILNEPEVLIHEKLIAVLEAGFQGVLCVGETGEQRQYGQTEAINRDQLVLGLAGIDKGRLDQLVIAYEPVWAIGTGKTATPEDAQAVHELLRSTLASAYDTESAATVPIQYGGSVNSDNATTLFSKPDIDGGLIGGASLNSDSFSKIVNAATLCCGNTSSEQSIQTP
ncbi:MAG: triose-phosphate isomerase [Phycisphaerales bacterium]|nr:triose-phosphate isomerase [Phycisphaerales bacterium]